MSRSRFICVCLVLAVAALSVCLVPVGSGPFSAAYGPLTKFQAIQWLLLLMFLIAAAVGIPTLSAVRRLVVFGLAFSGILLQVAAHPQENSVLRC